jgi:bacterioferritin-associated ferredoxin
LSGPTPYIYGDNKSQVFTLKKKCNSICYHAIRELVAMGETLLTHIRTGENLADFLTKTTSCAKCRKLLNEVVHDIYNNFPKQ